MPDGLVTVTSTVPLPAGATAVIELSEFTARCGAAFAPKLTRVAPVKPLPAMLTVVPPASGPPAGEMPLTLGGGGGGGGPPGGLAADTGAVRDEVAELVPASFVATTTTSSW